MTTISPPPAEVLEARKSLTQGQLPPWAQWSMVSACLVVGLLIGLTTGFSTALALVLGAVAALVVVPAVSWGVEGVRRAKDRLATLLVTLAFVLALLPLLSLLSTVVDRGRHRFDWKFLTDDMNRVVGEGGGAYHAIIGTLEITAAATIISVPIGVMCAVYLVEYGRGWLARSITLLVDVMTGIPSIVAGLFAFAFFSIFFGSGIRFGIGGAVALSLLMIPVVVRSVEEMLKLVPNELREASYALGVAKWLTVIRVVLRTAAAGIATGVTIAIARVIGETAPLLVIAGMATRTNYDLFDGRMTTLPVYIFNSNANPGARAEFGLERAWAAALTLVLIVLLLNLIARVISRVFALPTR
ncbi:phosphate ABC transporter permease PstA [Frankia sp. CNm7]|uniref:Phosphate transport system permease protein PstA n=1 Tax=Frankia nepalensis TaxID=1836974 RepID=A0A937UPQ4_9ACTN|nr:phosphate ABC transporter permease PstA [Frankia nepalensis]MBL7496212.1 phosphate ABC transporter permease PstA [Frankia nepalensis]MBL7511649.1 phosphate ABC transporter permease PstA [Frankia nepalensis]MBL7517726.1 phosphate ABC transporter permease PstA [Frankia nepalensis]MBL7631109.1 phosphate ABC transporter permease PstA [Frankia nepalensis]